MHRFLLLSATLLMGCGGVVDVSRPGDSTGSPDAAGDDAHANDSTPPDEADGGAVFSLTDSGTACTDRIPAALPDTDSQGLVSQLEQYLGDLRYDCPGASTTLCGVATVQIGAEGCARQITFSDPEVAHRAAASCFMERLTDVRFPPPPTNELSIEVELFECE